MKPTQKQQYDSFAPATEGQGIAIKAVRGIPVSERHVLALQVGLEAASAGERGVCLVLTASFLRAPIARGGIIQTVIYAAARGGRFEARANMGQFTRYTEATAGKATHQYSLKVGRTAGLEGGFAGLSGRTEGSDEVTSTTQFDGRTQPELVATQVGNTCIRWSQDFSREAKPVRDFLEGNLELRAEWQWPPTPRGSCHVEASPTHVKLFNADLQPLARLPNAAVWAYLEANDRAPVVGGIEFVVDIDRPPAPASGTISTEASRSDGTS